MPFHFHVGALRSGNLLCIYQTSPLPLFAKAEPSLAFDQTQMVSRTLDRKILEYLADNVLCWPTLILVLLNKGLSPHQCPNSPKCFDKASGSRESLQQTQARREEEAGTCCLA